MLSRAEILTKLEQQRTTLRSFQLRRLGLFGSHARGDARSDSDLDFVVEFREKSFDRYMDLEIFLEDLFHKRVDLVLLDRIKPRLKASILAEVVDVPGL
ncbi:MAG: nucleotidyltransferase family protein [Planctomycetota bacterium]